jgi:hypothetical protein
MAGCSCWWAALASSRRVFLCVVREGVVIVVGERGSCSLTWGSLVMWTKEQAVLEVERRRRTRIGVVWVHRCTWPRADATIISILTRTKKLV